MCTDSLSRGISTQRRPLMGMKQSTRQRCSVHSAGFLVSPGLERLQVLQKALAAALLLGFEL